MKSHHKTIILYLTDRHGEGMTPENMDEIIDAVVGLMGVHFPPLVLSSVAVSPPIADYKTGSLYHLLTVVAQGED